MTTSIPREVQAYLDAIPPGHRPLFGRLHRLILTAHPRAEVTLSYKMPAYRAGNRRIYIGAWKHGISIYGCGQHRDGGFTSRHPEMVTSKGTIQLRPDEEAAIPTRNSSPSPAPRWHRDRPFGWPRCGPAGRSAPWTRTRALGPGAPSVPARGRVHHLLDDALRLAGRRGGDAEQDVLRCTVAYAANRVRVTRDKTLTTCESAQYDG